MSDLIRRPGFGAAVAVKVSFRERLAAVLHCSPHASWDDLLEVARELDVDARAFGQRARDAEAELESIRRQQPLFGASK